MNYVGKKEVEPHITTQELPHELQAYLKDYSGIYFDIKDNKFKIMLVSKVPQGRSYIQAELIGPLMSGKITIDHILFSNSQELSEKLGFTWSIESRGNSVVVTDDDSSLLLWNTIVHMMPHQLQDYISQQMDKAQTAISAECTIIDTALAIITSNRNDHKETRNTTFHNQQWRPTGEIGDISTGEIGVCLTNEEGHELIAALVTPQIQINGELLQEELPYHYMNYCISQLNSEDRTAAIIYLQQRKNLLYGIKHSIENLITGEK